MKVATRSAMSADEVEFLLNNPKSKQQVAFESPALLLKFFEVPIIRTIRIIVRLQKYDTRLWVDVRKWKWYAGKWNPSKQGIYTEVDKWRTQILPCLLILLGYDEINDLKPVFEMMKRINEQPIDKPIKSSSKFNAT